MQPDPTVTLVRSPVAPGDVSAHRHFGSHDAPSTLLGVSVLGYPDQLVEVEAVAALR